MKEKQFIGFPVIPVLLVLLSASCVGFRGEESNIDWNKIARPGMDGVPVYASSEEAEAAGGGWYVTMDENFDGNSLPEEWVPSPHGLRWESQSAAHPEWANYWCPEMVKVRNGMVEIHSEKRTNHKCPDGICPSSGNFTSGIETRQIRNGETNQGSADQLLFSQAFGYFEARVRFPEAPGMWSAFWLQSSNQRKIGNNGEDGTEIDIYESAFMHRYNRTENLSIMGHALLWDGYGKNGKVEDFITAVSGNLHEGFHVFGLKWTPTEYIFYIDGKPTWMTNAGGVSKVREYLRLTCEIDAGDQYGPHGQRIGRFDDDTIPVFYVDYVKVWQHTGYSAFEKNDDEFKGETDPTN